MPGQVERDQAVVLTQGCDLRLPGFPGEGRPMHENDRRASFGPATSNQALRLEIIPAVDPLNVSFMRCSYLALYKGTRLF